MATIYKINLVILSIIIFFPYSNAHGNKDGRDRKQPIIEMVYVPGGELAIPQMDSLVNPSKNRLNKKIKILPFYISKYEITFEQLARVYNWGLQKGSIFLCCSVIGSANEHLTLFDFFELEGIAAGSSWKKIMVQKEKRNYPCTMISFNGAAEFCNLLSKMEGLDTCYFHDKVFGYSLKEEMNGYRLPTVAEWQFAALGGNKSNKFIYSGSNNPDKVAWFSENSKNHLHPVGKKSPNELGLYDMSGNVWEWCDTGYNGYPDGSNSWGHSLCGGCYESSPDELFIFNRRVVLNDCFTNTIGFRIVRSDPKYLRERQNKPQFKRRRRRKN